jgi:hypothetical protein
MERKEHTKIASDCRDNYDWTRIGCNFEFVLGLFG